MDYTNFNIIKIMPGIYICDLNAKLYENNLINLNIEYLININKTLDGLNSTTFNITMDPNLAYIDSSVPINIDFENTNEFIINA